MLDILARTLPFFAIIALGWGAARVRFFPPEANAWLTRFVFYFALSAMLVKLTANLEIASLLDLRVALAFLAIWISVWLIGLAQGLLRRLPLDEAAMEAQCGVIGNTGFLGLPMLVMIMGESAAVPVLQVLILDMLIFNPLIILMITAAREGRMRLSSLATLGRNLAKNPIIVSCIAGLGWNLSGIGVAAPVNDFLTLLGNAATPCALFVIGMSLAAGAGGSLAAPIRISVIKLILHPAIAAFVTLYVIALPGPVAAAITAAAALPVAGNVYMIAAHYGVAPQRVSASILVSTLAGIGTVTIVLSQVMQWQ